MGARYAIYFAPPRESLLWQAGCQWLGRDPSTGEALRQPGVPGWAAAHLAQWTFAPRLYGFHATLKAPFSLVNGCDEPALHAALEQFAVEREPFPLPLLQVAILSGFLALRPAARSHALHALADDCVVRLDHLRQPPDESELARRRSAGLTPRQETLLAKYGYPYVLEEYRFHLTLTDRLLPECGARLLPWLAGHFARALGEPLRVDGICLFIQDRPGAAFRLARRFAFAAARR